MKQPHETAETPTACVREAVQDPWAALLAGYEPGSRPGKPAIVPAEPGYRVAVFPSDGGAPRLVPIIAWSAQPFATDAWWLDSDKELCRIEVVPVTILGAVFDALVVDPAGTWLSPEAGLIFPDEATARRWWRAEHGKS